MVSMTRSGLDYEFFRILSERIDRAADEKKEQLEALRERLLELTQEIDRRMQEQMKESLGLLNQILGSENVTEAAQEALPPFCCQARVGRQ
jgi:DNA-binding transcriptional regulator GbsR (MarR family)